MLYNNPGSANVDVKPALIARMAESTKVTYVKESTVDVRRIHQIKRLCGDRVQACATWASDPSWSAPTAGSRCAPMSSGRRPACSTVGRDRDYAARAPLRHQPVIERWALTGTSRGQACFD
jgi:4-hydroxy-tetrahydrodipicolinate synthase